MLPLTLTHHLTRGRHWLLAGLLLAGRAQAQTPTWQSALAIGDDAQVTAMTTDAAGNVYLAGYFNHTASFGSLVLTNTGGADTFVAKWNTAQNAFAWAQQAGGSTTSGAFTTALAVSGSSVYVAGRADGTPSFGSFTVPTNGTGYSAVYVAKLSDAGTSASFTWLQASSGPGSNYATALASTGTSIYVTGYFDASISFGNTTLVNTPPGVTPPVGGTPGGGGSLPVDTFLAKLVDAGSSAVFTGALRVGGVRNERPVALATSGTSVYLASNSDSVPATFDGSPAGAVNGGQMLVAKLIDASPMGAFTWVQRIDGLGQNLTTSLQYGVDVLTALAVAGNNLYVTGAFLNPQIDVGGVVLTNNSTTPNTYDLFLTKLTDTGTTGRFDWVQGLPSSSPGSKISRAVAVRGADLYLAGTFTGTATFGTTSLVSAGYTDIFVAKLTDTGTAASVGWAQQAGGPQNDFALALAVAGPRIHVGGTYQFPAASFGNTNLALTSPSATSGGYWATLSETSTLATTTTNPPSETSLFPNPAATYTTLRLPAVTEARPVQVLDALGRPVRRQLLPARTAATALDLSGLAPGVYLVRCGAMMARLLVE